MSESAALAIRNMSDKSDAIKDIEMVKNHLLSSLTLQVCNYFLFSGWEQCKKIVWDLKEILLRLYLQLIFMFEILFSLIFSRLPINKFV